MSLAIQGFDVFENWFKSPQLLLNFDPNQAQTSGNFFERPQIVISQGPDTDKLALGLIPSQVKVKNTVNTSYELKKGQYRMSESSFVLFENSGSS